VKNVILRGCEEILSEGGSEGRERRIFGYTGSTLPTEGRRNHRPRCATNRTVCAIGLSPAGVTEDPSLPPLGPTPLRISSQPLSVAKDPSAAEPQPTLPYVILSRRSAAKNLRLRSLRSFAVYAAQDDVGSNRRCMRRFSDVVVQERNLRFFAVPSASLRASFAAQDDGDFLESGCARKNAHI